MQNRATTIEKAINGVQVSFYQSRWPERGLIIMIGLIENLLQRFDTIRGLKNENDVIRTAKGILKKFWFLKFEEITYVFQNFESYVKVYDRIDEQVIYDALHSYDKDRLSYVDKYNQELKEKQEEDFNSDNMYRITKMYYKELEQREKFKKEEEREKYNNYILFKIERQKQQKAMNEYIKKVLDKFEITFNDLFSGSKKREIADAKAVIQYYQNTVMKWSERTIAKFWNYTDHTTVSHNIQKVKDLKLNELVD